MKALLLSFYLWVTVPAFAQPSARYKPIVLNPSYEHTKWQTSPSDLAFEFAAFTSSFDSDDDNDGDGQGESWGIPEWVAYEIKRVENLPSGGGRPSSWMTVPELHEEGIAPDDDTYHVAGTAQMREVKTNYRFVRGHLCMKLIVRRVSLDAEYNTHTVLNAVPQLQWQNEGVWNGLEMQTIEWAQKYERIWVATGPVFFGKSPALWLGQKGEVQAAVPDALYKIVIREIDGRPKAIAFLFPNIQPSDIDDEDFAQFLTSVDRIEELTGLDFMSNATEVESIESSNENLSESDKQQVVLDW